MIVFSRILAFALICISAGCAPVAACNSFAQDVSDATAPLVALGIAATFLGSVDDAQSDAARVADAAIIAVGTAELLKPNIRIGHGDELHGFPSGHAAIAFGAASALGEAHPRHKWLYYAGAALIGWSRVETGAHSWGDVLGGAALGITVGKWSMSSSDGLMIGRAYRF